MRWLDWLLLLVIVTTATLTRAWYLHDCVDVGSAAAPLQVQDSPAAWKELADRDKHGRFKQNELDNLAYNLTHEAQQFASYAPLSDKEEQTAHIAPGYVWLLAISDGFFEDPHWVLRWLNCVLGVFTAVFYFLFARQAFDSRVVGTFAGLLAALHPFWIINTAEINDGALVTFLLAASLCLGTRAAQAGESVAGLAFGLSLAGLSLVRAAMLPFTLLSMMWFLLHSRQVKKGWFCALLAFLGFANGLAPWMVRNYQAFDRPVPIADSAYYHLWMGNNPQATGGPIDDRTLQANLDQQRLGKLLAESNQSRRYDMLSQEVLEEIVADPANTLARRLWAGLYFVFGKAWFDSHQLALHTTAGAERALPSWLEQSRDGILHGTLLAMVLFGLLGWRWSFPHRQRTQLAALAAIWVPLPYLLGHAEMLSGPRLPLDGVWLTFTAFAVAYMIPGMARKLSAEPAP